MDMKTVKGDIVQLAKDGEFEVIIHGCNCFHTMGAGVALAIKKAFPEAYEADLKTNKGDELKLGTISIAETKDGLIIVNAYTQFGCNSKDKPFSRPSLFSSLLQIRTFFHDKKIGYPMIGAGLGGGDWNEISKTIDVCLDKLDHTLVFYEEPKPETPDVPIWDIPLGLN